MLKNSTAFSYSLGGLGDVTFRGNAIDRMMGGLSVYADSIHANINNPASLGELKLTTFYPKQNCLLECITSHYGIPN